jgi:hypothetical protein
MFMVILAVEGLSIGLVMVLSMEDAACFTREMRFSNVCPLHSKRFKNFVRMSWKVIGSFCSQYWCISPAMSPLKQLGGCTESKGM